MTRAFAAKNYVEMVSPLQYETFLDEEKPIVLQAGATWCGPCKFLKPRMLKVGREYQDEVKYVFMDIDKFPEIAEKLDIQHIPKTVMLYKGDLVNQFSGVPQEDAKLHDFFQHAK